MIYLIGASGHAKVVLGILEKRMLSIGGLMDKDPSITSLFEYPVGLAFPSTFDAHKDQVVISIGNNAMRKKVAQAYPYSFISAIHPHANISIRAFIGKGTVIMAGATVNSGVKIGMHAIINTSCSIDHDCVIEDYVHVSPQVGLAGQVFVGEGTHIGIGANVIPGIRIGKWCTIGAGAVIIKDVPDGCTVVGNPGKVI